MDSAEAPRPVAKRPARHRIGWWVGIGALLVALGAVDLLVHDLNSPAQGVVHQTVVADASAKVTPPLKVEGKAVIFEYPASLEKIKPDTLSPGDIEKFLFTMPTHHAWSLAIQVKSLAGGTLTGDSGYNLRKQNPQQYTEQVSVVNGMTISVMSDKSGPYNQVAFIPHGNLVAEVALSGTDSSDTSSQKIFDTVIDTWQWR